LAGADKVLAVFVVQLAVQQEVFPRLRLAALAEIRLGVVELGAVGVQSKCVGTKAAEEIRLASQVAWRLEKPS
jgi:hypothetical protein